MNGEPIQDPPVAQSPFEADSRLHPNTSASISPRSMSEGCTISVGRAIGGMDFVCCTEVVRPLESPLLEVSLYLCMCNITGGMVIKDSGS